MVCSSFSGHIIEEECKVIYVKIFDFDLIFYWSVNGTCMSLCGSQDNFVELILSFHLYLDS